MRTVFGVHPGNLCGKSEIAYSSPVNLTNASAFPGDPGPRVGKSCIPQCWEKRIKKNKGETEVTIVNRNSTVVSMG